MRTVKLERSVGWLAMFLALALGAASLGGYFSSKSVRSWYPSLRKPSWTPPGWLFGPVWTLLYILMAISAWLVRRDAKRNPQLARSGAFALAAWVQQLALNVTWSYVFFGRRRIGEGLGTIVALWWSILEATCLASRVSRVGGLLLLPYLAWTTFAAALNFQIWRLNRH